MSQEKVDKYKKEKQNRQSTMKRNKLVNRIEMTLCAVAGVAILGWIGYSAYGTIQANKEANAPEVEYSISTTALDDYISALSSQE